MMTQRPDIARPVADGETPVDRENGLFLIIKNRVRDFRESLDRSELQLQEKNVPPTLEKLRALQDTIDDLVILMEERAIFGFSKTAEYIRQAISQSTSIYNHLKDAIVGGVTKDVGRRSVSLDPFVRNLKNIPESILQPLMTLSVEEWKKITDEEARIVETEGSASGLRNMVMTVIEARLYEGITSGSVNISGDEGEELGIQRILLEGNHVPGLMRGAPPFHDIQLKVNNITELSDYSRRGDPSHPLYSLFILEYLSGDRVTANQAALKERELVVKRLALPEEFNGFICRVIELTTEMVQKRQQLYNDQDHCTYVDVGGGKSELVWRERGTYREELLSRRKFFGPQMHEIAQRTARFYEQLLSEVVSGLLMKKDFYVDQDGKRLGGV